MFKVKKIFTAGFLSIILFCGSFLFANQALARGCEEIGGTCLPGDQSQANYTEFGAGTCFNTQEKCFFPKQCICYTDLGPISQAVNSGQAVDFATVINSGCNNAQTSGVCDPKQGALTYSKCDKLDNINLCQEFKAKWEDEKTSLAGGQATHQQNLGIIGSFFPSCVITDTNQLSPECSNVGIFVEFGINVAKFLFGIIGALALGMFVYGGFVLILSQGNPEKVKQGTGIMIAAVTGLAIAFGAYFLVRFLSGVVGVTTTLQ